MLGISATKSLEGRSQRLLEVLQSSIISRRFHLSISMKELSLVLTYRYSD